MWLRILSAPQAGEDADALQEALQQESTNDAILSHFSDIIPAVTDVSLDPSFGVYASVSLTVDSTNTDDVNASVDAFEVAVSDDWTVDSEGKYEFYYNVSVFILFSF